MKHERREYERYCIPMDVLLETHNGRKLTMHMYDISVGGTFLQIVNPDIALPTVGSTVRLTIAYQSEFGPEEETVVAQVVRANSQGIGLRFLRDQAHYRLSA